MEIEKKDTNRDSNNKDIVFPKKHRIIFLCLAVLLLIVVSINCKLVWALDDWAKKGVSSWQDATRTNIKVTEVALKMTVDAATGTQKYKDDAAVLTEYWKANAPVLTGIMSTQISIEKTSEANVISEKKTITAIYATIDSKNTQEAEANKPKPPELIRIEWPALVPKTGEAVWVTVYYEDPNGDVSHYGCEVIEGNWTCGKHEIEHWLKGNKYKGTFRYTMRCYGNQNVQLAIRLFDWKGNVSNPYIIYFACR